MGWGGRWGELPEAGTSQRRGAAGLLRKELPAPVRLRPSPSRSEN